MRAKLMPGLTEGLESDDLDHVAALPHLQIGDLALVTGLVLNLDRVDGQQGFGVVRLVFH